MKTLGCVALALLIYAVEIQAEEKHHKKGNETTCGHTFGELQGIIHVSSGKSSTVREEITECKWFIWFNGTNTTKAEDHKIFLIFDDLFLEEEDTITIFSADGKPLPHFNPFSFKREESGIVSYLTGESNITVWLQTPKRKENKPDRRFQMQFYSNSTCNHKFNNTVAGIVKSPLYDSLNYAMPVDCSFDLYPNGNDNHHFNLWFNKYTFNQGTVSVVGSLAHDGTFNADNFTSEEFLSDKSPLTLSWQITNNSINPEVFIASYESVHPSCISVEQLTDGGMARKLPFPDLGTLQSIISGPSPQLSCLWLVECEKDHTITVNLNKLSLPGVRDQVLILDGPNRSSPVLSEIGTNNKKQERIIFSSGASVWIYASAPFLNETFNIEISVVQTKTGGRKQGQGTVDASGDDDSTTFLLEVASEQQVKFIIDQASKLASGSSVNFYSDFLKTSQPFFALDPTKKLYPVASPTNQMAIVTQSFKSSKLTGTFMGIQQGCYELTLGSGDTYSVVGNCNNTCAWTVNIPSAKLSPGDLLGFHFQSLNLSGNDVVLIRKLDAAQTLVANLSAPLSTFPDLWLPADTGAFLQVSRNNCNNNNTVLKASYLISPRCNATLSPQLNESLTITSPGYPNHYPLGAACNWTVLKPKDCLFLHVTLKDLQLAAQGHTLRLYEKQNMTLIANFSGGNSQGLPNDIPVFSDLLVEFSSTTNLPQVSLPGFQMQITVVDQGFFFDGSTSGNVSTPGYPSPVSNGSTFVWVVNTKSTKEQKEIIQFHFDNQTSHPDLNKYLKIYDGGSLRSQEIQNFTSTELLSKYDTLILVYQRNTTSPSPAFSMAFHNFNCNMSLMCENGICMHNDWHCNGLNDCGDYSDERNCEGGLAPTPPPSPEPSHQGSEGVSTAALAVGILIALVIGAALGVGAPAAYRRIRGTQFRSYSSFTNNME